MELLWLLFIGQYSFGLASIEAGISPEEKGLKVILCYVCYIQFFKKSMYLKFFKILLLVEERKALRPARRTLREERKPSW